MGTRVRTPTTCDSGSEHSPSSLVATCATGSSVSRTIEGRELRDDNAKVIDALAAGETFVVTRNGVPVAELPPIAPSARFAWRERAASRLIIRDKPAALSAWFVTGPAMRGLLADPSGEVE